MAENINPNGFENRDSDKESGDIKKFRMSKKQFDATLATIYGTKSVDGLRAVKNHNEEHMVDQALKDQEAYLLSKSKERRIFKNKDGGQIISKSDDQKDDRPAIGQKEADMMESRMVKWNPEFLELDGDLQYKNNKRKIKTNNKRPEKEAKMPESKENFVGNPENFREPLPYEVKTPTEKEAELDREKIESLQSENRDLKKQIADKDKENDVLAKELAEAKRKVDLLEKERADREEADRSKKPGWAEVKALKEAGVNVVDHKEHFAHCLENLESAVLSGKSLDAQTIEDIGEVLSENEKNFEERDYKNIVYKLESLTRSPEEAKTQRLSGKDLENLEKETHDQRVNDLAEKIKMDRSKVTWTPEDLQFYKTHASEIEKRLDEEVQSDQKKKNGDTANEEEIQPNNQRENHYRSHSKGAVDLSGAKEKINESEEPQDPTSQPVNYAAEMRKQMAKHQERSRQQRNDWWNKPVFHISRPKFLKRNKEK